MITAIDTNVLMDIFTADTKFAEKSAAALRNCLNKGSVVACDIVWAETSSVFPDTSQFNSVINSLSIQFSPMNSSSAQLAGEFWQQYRKKGGSKSRIVADFLIAAHALLQCDCLLTRDKGFYRKYFKNLKIIDPSK